MIDVYKKSHICNTCKNVYPECNADKVEFGNGKGNDNIVNCDCYESKNPHVKGFYCPNCGCEVCADKDFGEVICCRCFTIWH